VGVEDALPKLAHPLSLWGGEVAANAEALWPKSKASKALPVGGVEALFDVVIGLEGPKKLNRSSVEPETGGLDVLGDLRLLELVRVLLLERALILPDLGLVVDDVDDDDEDMVEAAAATLGADADLDLLVAVLEPFEPY
jgi:hypothetical protein